jgi:hypothetical protein
MGGSHSWGYLNHAETPEPGTNGNDREKLQSVKKSVKFI